MSAAAPAPEWQTEGYGHAESPSGLAPTPTIYEAPAEATRHPQHPYIHGHEREYLLSLVLTVLTLGIYHFYYHYKTHDELCQQLGRPNDIKPLFLAYVGVVVLAIGLFTIGPLAIIGALLLLAFVVHRQYAAIADARRRLALAPRGDTKYFLLWNYLGAFILAGPFIAYYNLVHNYNDIWMTLRHGGHLATDADQPSAAGDQYATKADPAYTATPASSVATHPATAAAPTTTTRPAPAQTDQPAPSPSPASFNLRTRHEPVPAPELVEQAFQCPRWQTHVAVRGTEGEEVTARCGACGETGQVRIGD